MKLLKKSDKPNSVYIEIDERFKSAFLPGRTLVAVPADNANCRGCRLAVFGPNESWATPFNFARLATCKRVLCGAKQRADGVETIFMEERKMKCIDQLN